MRLSLAANFDDALLPKLADYQVTEVFGAASGGGIGHGRAGYMVTPVDWGRLDRYVQTAHRHGIGFNYLINPACMGNREFTRNGQRELRTLLDRLADLQIETVTVSMPFLLEIIKARYPQFKVKVGVYAKVSTVQQAQAWEKLGADCITLEFLSINRDFERLQAIRSAVNCDLQLIANSTCLLNCPFAPSHMVGLSHASRDISEGRFFVDYCLLRCSTLRLMEPAHFLRSPWIRPEDLHYYEAIGYHDFKILERDAPSEVLLTRVQAYSQRQFEGNLLDLMQPYGYRTPRTARQPRRPRLWEFREFLRPRHVSPTRLLRWKHLAHLQGMLFPLEGESPIVIDNRSLDGRIDHIYTQRCGQIDCTACGYCERLAAETVLVSEVVRKAITELSEVLLSDMTTGALWGGSAPHHGSP